MLWLWMLSLFPAQLLRQLYACSHPHQSTGVIGPVCAVGAMGSRDLVSGPAGSWPQLPLR